MQVCGLVTVSCTYRTIVRLCCRDRFILFHSVSFVPSPSFRLFLSPCCSLSLFPSPCFHLFRNFSFPVRIIFFSHSCLHVSYFSVSTLPLIYLFTPLSLISFVVDLLSILSPSVFITLFRSIWLLISNPISTALLSFFVYITSYISHLFSLLFIFIASVSFLPSLPLSLTMTSLWNILRS